MTLLADVEAFMARTKMGQSRFGRDAASDPRLVADLRLGRRPGSRLERKVRRYMERHR